MTQPTALYLADLLEDAGKPADIAEKAAAELRRLYAENEALRADAERYRWLRDTLHSAVGGGIEVNDLRLVYEEPEPGEEVRVYWYPVTPVGFNQAHGKTLDDAVDAAREE